MRKKMVLALFMAALLAGGAFAQISMSAGGGIALVPSFSSTKYKGDVMVIGNSNTSGFGFEINGLFDVTYAEFTLGLLFDKPYSDLDITTTNLTIGLFGKYPFTISNQLVVFPFAGLDFLINLGAKLGSITLDDADVRAKMFNTMSIVFGAGADYSINEALFFRAEVGFGFILNTQNENDSSSLYDSHFKGKIPIRLAVGYRL